MSMFVGCDLGTSGVRATVVDGDGVVRGDASREVPLYRPAAGQAEQDLVEMQKLAHAVIAEALARAGSPKRVGAIAVSSQMSGIGAVDAQGAPAMRYDSWLDNRCEPQIASLADRAELVRRVSGCAPTYSHAPKMLYWRDERPDVWGRIRRFVSAGGYVAGCLAGLDADDMYLDRSYAHFTNLADIRTGEWSPELLEAVGLDDSRLPRLVESTDVIGEVTREASELTGLPRGTPIVAGAGDTTASALGAGVTKVGQAYDVAGTASVLGFCVDSVPQLETVAGRSLVWSRGLVPGTFLALSFINGGGLALRWLRDECARELDEAGSYEQLIADAAEIPVGAEGLLWFPHLQGQVLPPRPRSRAALLGITSRHGRAHVMRAILEGIGLEYSRWAREVRSGLGIVPTEVRVVGGGAVSKVWNSIKSDAVGVPWVPVDRQECGVLGDAMLAAVATGHGSWESVARWQSTSAAMLPDADRSAQYQLLLHDYDRMVSAMEVLYGQSGFSGLEDERGHPQ